MNQLWDYLIKTQLYPGSEFLCSHHYCVYTVYASHQDTIYIQKAASQQELITSYTYERKETITEKAALLKNKQNSHTHCSLKLIFYLQLIH